MKNAFLRSTLSQTVFCSQPTGFANPARLDLVCCLNKSLCKLKQAPRTWYNRFTTYLTSLRFIEAKSDSSLFILHHGSDTVYLLLYVDDIILTASSMELLCCTISALHYFLNITVERCPNGFLLHQRTYMMHVIQRAAMADCKPCMTPVDLQAKFVVDLGPLVQDASQFWSITGALQYLTFNQPNIAYAVQ
jgi:hypothetical protein